MVHANCYIVEAHVATMPTVGTSSSGQFACVTATQHCLRDLRIKRKGQPVYVMGHVVERKGQEATFEVFNDRLAVVRFSDGAVLGYDPSELLLPTDIAEDGTAFFEIRTCRQCEQLYALAMDECESEEEPIACPACRN